jgi:hypothetical protein
MRAAFLFWLGRRVAMVSELALPEQVRLAEDFARRKKIIVAGQYQRKN